MEDMERLAIAQAVYKMVADAISTKNPDSLRGRLDAAMLDAYDANGIKSRDLRIGNDKVGTYSVTVKKAVHRSHVEVTDEDAYEMWADANGLTKVVVDAAAVQAWTEDTGEVPDGCAIVTEDVRQDLFVAKPPERLLRSCRVREDHAPIQGRQTVRTHEGLLAVAGDRERLRQEVSDRGNR